MNPDGTITWNNPIIPASVQNAFARWGTPADLSIKEITALDVVGWDLKVSSTVPEPGSLALLGIGLAGLGFARRRKQTTG